MIKICSYCKLEKDTDKNDFRFMARRASYSARCRSCENLINKRYKENNRDLIKEYQRNYIKNYMPGYVAEHKDKLKQYRQEYRLANKSKIRLYRNEYEKVKRKTDPDFKLRKDLSRIIRRSLKKIGLSKNKPFKKFLAYSVSRLKEHLEVRFEPWMNWNNQGKYDARTWNDLDSSTWTWHIDHIVPQSFFDFSKEEEIKKCWDLSNLRPYPSKLNVIKGNRR